jgi:RNA polymerase sigma-70 factor, ECF subfamily
MAVMATDDLSSSHRAAAEHPRSGEHPTASTALLRGVQKMDATAWGRLVDTFGGIVYRWCRVSGLRPEDAADVVQEVFVSVARGIERFERQKPVGSFRSWLATITRNQLRDHFRRQARREQARGGTDAIAVLEQHAEQLDSTICGKSIRGAIAQRVLESLRNEVEPNTWAALWMTTVEGRTPADAADATGLSVASVYQAKSRILRKLRLRLAELL